MHATRKEEADERGKRSRELRGEDATPRTSSRAATEGDDRAPPEMPHVPRVSPDENALREDRRVRTVPGNGDIHVPQVPIVLPSEVIRSSELYTVTVFPSMRKSLFLILRNEHDFPRVNRTQGETPPPFDLDLAFREHFIYIVLRNSPS